MMPPENIPYPIATPVMPVPVVLPPIEMRQPSAPVQTVGVLHLINGEYYAGAERVQDLLAQHLPALGFSVGFACVKLDLFDAMRESHDAPLYDVRMRNRFDITIASRLTKIVQQNDYRLIHCHSVRTALIGNIVSRRTGVPMAYHVHSPASRDSTRYWRDRFNGWVERLSLRRASRVITVSHALAEHIERMGIEPDRIRVVPNGVPELAEFPDRSRPIGCWTLGIAALFRPRKGLEVLLDAMARLLQDGVPVHLRAVGSFESPQYAAEIAAHVERLRLSDHITWTGFTRDVAGEMQKMDLFVLPSLFGEGLPMVVLEAMTAGVPIVAARVPGIPEAIRDGQDGLLVEPGNAADLTRAIAAVMRGEYDWSALRANARTRHAACFSDRAMASGVAAVYREILGC
jgi:glycosyltransferase involved in cell wall biosynthesis